MGGYKVRLDDGSEIGPLDLASVRSWFSDGLINPESLVLTPGSRRWAPLKQAIDIKDWGGLSQRSAGGRKRAAARDDDDVPSRRSHWDSGESRVEHLRTPLGGALFLIGAAIAGFWVWRPEQQRAVLHDWPWAQIALGLLALGLCLFVRPRITRPIVFAALLLGTIAALAMIGVLVVQKSPQVAFIVLGGGIVACFGFLAMLEGRSASWLRTILGTLAVVGGFGAAAKYGYLPPDETESVVHAWVLPGMEISDTRVGMSFRLSNGWRFVKPDAPFMAAPAAALGRIARADGAAFAYLVAERVPAGVVDLEPLSERAVALRRLVVPSLRAIERVKTQIGNLPASQVVGESGDFGSPTVESVTVWRDGFTQYTLVGWGRGDTRAESARRFDELASGFESLAGRGVQLSDAVQKAAVQVPFLSSGMVERLMSASEAEVLEPSEIFKRALILAGRGVPRLAPSEVKELQGLLDLTYRNMDRRDRARLADYLGAVRGSGTSDVEQDRQMCALMAGAVMQLPTVARQRLQALYDQTILAAWTDGTTVR